MKIRANRGEDQWIPIKKHCKTLGKTIVSVRINAKPKEHQRIPIKTLQNLRKTIISLKNIAKTLGKTIVSLKISAKPKENQ